MHNSMKGSHTVSVAECISGYLTACAMGSLYGQQHAIPPRLWRCCSCVADTVSVVHCCVWVQ